ncbi:MAG: hypothetical protein AW12_02364 [Candidatus Accumulibacter sp. BA-94]|nr:MAG: hypothetical protein AW12_02364 [Candidatus Accumulibacter sp. BA-94]
MPTSGSAGHQRSQPRAGQSSVVSQRRNTSLSNAPTSAAASETPGTPSSGA